MGTPDVDSQNHTRTAVPGTRTMGVGEPADTVTHWPAANTPPHDGTTPFGPPGFELLGKIAEGGMGVVLRARDLAVGRVVALKVLKLNVFDERAARARFAREVRAMARIEHPHLVPVYQSGEHNGVPYFTMKYMPGGTLAAVRSNGPLPPRRAAELLRAIAGGVAAMHACHILHRDLKPSNVLLDEGGVPHVADFGLVKWTDEDEHTQTGSRLGTPQYMSPEQVAGRSRKLTAACDVWALGVIGYELACGRRPFDHDDREDLYRAITHDPPPDPHALAAGLPVSLAQVLLACLQKDPLARYPSAAELAADLDRFLAGQPVNATSPETVTLPSRPGRRTFLKVAAGVLGVGAAGGLGAYLFTRKRPQPPNPPELPFAESVLADLAASKPVDLLDADGRPKWSAMFPTDSLVATTDPLTLTPNPAAGRFLGCGWLDLFATPIPHPFRFEAEVRFRADPDPTEAVVGVYVGRRLWQAGGAVWHTVVTLRQPAPPTPADRVVAGLEFIADPVQEVMTFTPYDLAECGGPPAAPPADGWVRLAIELRGDRLTAECNGGRAEPPRNKNGLALRNGLHERIRLHRKVVGRLNDQPVPIPDFAAEPSLFGPALGVFVWKAAASVRSARLVPLSEDRP